MSESINNTPDIEGLSPILTVEEVARFLRLGRTTCYEAVRCGTIPSLRIGYQYRIVRDQLLAWLAESGGLKNEADEGTSAGVGALEVWRNGRSNLAR